jgi:hypothetical protein
MTVWRRGKGIILDGPIAAIAALKSRFPNGHQVRALSSASNAMCSKEFAPGASDILKQALV